jgi:acyl-CoA dehydrogenase
VISFELTDQQKQVRELVHWFAENEMRPLSLPADKAGEVPLDWLNKVNAMGISLSTSVVGGASRKSASDREAKAALEHPEAARQTNRLGVIASEEMGWGDPAIALSLPGPGLGGPPVQASGTPDQKARFLGMFKKDKARWGAYALTEPDAGSDVSGIRTTAKKVDGGYLLNGQKIFITNGGRASWVVVFATVDASLGRAGHRAFVVEQGTPGFSCTRLAHKMGMRASETAELVFEDCFVAEENLLGGESSYAAKASGPSGFRVAMATFDTTRPMVAAMAIGIARAAYEYTLEYVQKEYPKAGRSFQTAAAKLADMKTDIEAARLLTWEAAWMGDAGMPNTKEAAMCKAYAGKAALAICTDCLELFGPIGMEGHLVEKLYRDVKVYDIFEGTNQIQHLIIARRLYEQEGLRI